MPKCILGLQETLVALLPQAAPVTLHCVPNPNEGNLLFVIYTLYTLSTALLLASVLLLAEWLPSRKQNHG